MTTFNLEFVPLRAPVVVERERERERERVSVGDMGRLRMLENGFGFGSISDAGERFAFGSNSHVVLLVN
jgi:hypothetical protein